MKLFVFALLTTTTFLTACTNNGAGIYGKTSSYSFGNSSGVGATDSPTASGVVGLSSVIADKFDPSGTLDLIGDGTNTIGTNCQSSGSTGSTNLQGTGTSTCQCNFSYTRSNGATGQVYVDTTYHEANLIRCPYNTLPTDVSSVNVSIHLVSGGQDSNSISYSLTGGGGSLDLSLANNFNLVKRYQCKDIVTIPYPGQDLQAANAIYDPIQSEDSSISFPLNFYTANFGGTFSLYAGSNIQNWNCPSIPNDTSVAGLDLRVFSTGADNAGSKTIYPPAGSSFDRSTFYVAKQKGGVFSVALDTYVAPQLYANGGGAAPVGYGAVPISTGSTSETCPDTSVTIPTGFHWAKLWLFRADLANRFYLRSAPINTLGIGCNPGFSVLGGVQTMPAFDDCVTPAQKTAHSYGGITFNTGPAALADRILGGAGNSAHSMCVNLNGIFGQCNDAAGGKGPGCTTNVGGTTQRGAPGSIDLQFGLGTDIWQPYEQTVPNDAFLVDPLNLYGNPVGAPQNIPRDAAPTTANIDLANPQNPHFGRYDFLFVVTPTSVMASTMENSSSSANYPYVPYRFPSKADCLSNDPDNPSSPTDCQASKIIHYGLKLHDISTNGDPSGTDANRAGVFPMCVLQPN